MQTQNPELTGTPISAVEEPKYFRILIPLALLLGLALRLMEAVPNYLNPDEAIHFCRSQPANWYQISTTKGTAPFFFFFVVHHIQAISNSEVFLRLPFVLSGVIFPWIIFRWLNRLQFPIAALFAFFILEFSPNLIALTAQVRGYALALLFVSLAIFFLQRSLDLRSIPSLVLSTAFLYLAILTEFSVALATGALGAYSLIVLIRQPRPIHFTIIWILSQFGALALYAFLYQTPMANLLAGPYVSTSINGYLKGGFPKPGENLLFYALVNTLKQFAYLASSIPVGILFAGLSLTGLIFLWRGPPQTESTGKLSKWRGLAVTVLVVFLLGLCASLLHLFPLGRSRHSVILALFSAPAIGLGFHWLLSTRPRLVLQSSLLVTAIMFVCAREDAHNISRSRDSISAMLQATTDLRASVPPGSFLFTDHETQWMMNYYLGDRRCTIDDFQPGGQRTSVLPPYRVASLRWSHESLDQIITDTARIRELNQLPAQYPIYVLDGGFIILPKLTPASKLLHGALLLISPPSAEGQP